VSGGALFTPRTVACPEGITRDTVLQLAPAAGIPVTVRDVSLVEMYTADEVFCTGTMGELAAVTTIDGRRIGGGEVGPVTKELSALYRAHARANGVAV
jgi:branched-chain amino acid aminotransferase